MRPASRRALLERLSAAAPRVGARSWLVAVLVIALIGIVAVAWLADRSETPPSVATADESTAPVLDPVLALPFGRGPAKVPTPPVPDANTSVANAALRSTYARSDDRQALYRQWRERPEADARYLAYRSARDCSLLLAGGVTAEIDATSERRNEREKQMAAGAARCRGFVGEPPAPDEMQRLVQQAAEAGHPAAQVVLAATTYTQHSLAETIEVLRRSLASGDPLAFDEARVLLAMSRHQVEIAGVAPTATTDARNTDARVVAIDLVGCQLGNPCGPGGGVVAIDCESSAPCLRDAQEWVLQMADLGDDERRTAIALAERMFAAFKRGAVDEIVRLPANSR